MLMIQRCDTSSSLDVKTALRRGNVKSLVVSNDGRAFSEADWKHLVTIAQTITRTPAGWASLVSASIPFFD